MYDPPMIPATLKHRLTNADAVLGAWLFLREPLAAEVSARCGYDYVCIDGQHGLHSYDTITAMLAAGSAGDAVPIVRVPWNEPGFIGQVLDAGALGVIIPMVNSVPEAEAAVAACRYPPKGTRSLGPVGAGTRFGTDYIARANDSVAVIPMIETVDGVANVDEIAAVPGVDALYVGPADLSLSLGLPPGMDQEDASFDDALTKVVAACERAGIIPGIHTSPELARRRRDQGFRFLTVGYDLNPMVAGIHAALAQTRGNLRM